MKRVFNLLVVDESGSMEIIRKQALVGINETLETIRKIHKAHSELEQRVTLITFDSTHKKLFYDNVLVTIVTDGEENCSEEYSLRMIKNLIEKLKKQGWTFTFIGTDNLDVEAIAVDMGIDNHLTFQEDEEGTKKMFARENFSRVRYSACLAKGVEMPEGGYFDKKKK